MTAQTIALIIGWSMVGLFDLAIIAEFFRPEVTRGIPNDKEIARAARLCRKAEQMLRDIG